MTRSEFPVLEIFAGVAALTFRSAESAKYEAAPYCRKRRRPKVRNGGLLLRSLPVSGLDILKICAVGREMWREIPHRLPPKAKVAQCVALRHSQSLHASFQNLPLVKSLRVKSPPSCGI